MPLTAAQKGPPKLEQGLAMKYIIIERAQDHEEREGKPTSTNAYP